MTDSVRKKRKAIKKKFYGVLTLILGAVIVFFFVVNLVTPSKDFSAEENRSLAKRPDLTWASIADGSFFKNFDSYYSDQFTGRNMWMSIKTGGEMLMGWRESNNIFFGHDGYLLQQPSTPDLKAENAAINAINTFTSNHSKIRSTMILVPGAASVLKNRLPANAPVRDQVADVEAFEMDLNNKIRTVDAGAVLKEHRTQPVYYKTDHHWTSRGARDVFDAAASSLGISKPYTNYNIYTVSESFQGTLASRSGKHTSKDKIQVYIPAGCDVRYTVSYSDSDKKSASMFQSSKLNEKDQYQVFFGGNHPMVDIQTTADNEKTLLVFKDSYANSFMQFLYPYYSRIIMIDPRYYYDDLGTAMKSWNVTDVLYMYSADTLLTDKTISDVLSTANS